MDIKNRLEKLENVAGLNSEYCTCRSGKQTRVIGPDVTEEEHQLKLAEAQKDEFCQRCNKLIEKQLIIIEVVNGNNGPREVTGATLATFNIHTNRNE